MKYFSTRGGSEELSFEETVLAGLAPDGGLYIPVSIPPLPENWESTWKDYSFQQLAFAILSLYISPEEIPPTDLKALIEKSYSAFRNETITPLHTYSPQLHILELFHGPTYAFKDVALQFLGNLFEYFLSRRNARLPPDAEPETITILGATSGDTGSAAIYGLRSKPNITIFILHPRGRVSPIQEAQMTTVLDGNVNNLAVHGMFDDCQDIVKELFNDAEFRTKYNLGAVNSINWARILAQIVYYFSAYFQARRAGVSGELQFVVPTGNFGDVLAGWYAKKMGLPMNKLGIATNANDILARFWKKEEFFKGDEGVLETHSPAMDIVVSSNFERLLWYLAYDSLEGEEERRLRAGALVKGWMGLLKEDGKVPMPTNILALSKNDFVADSVSNDETLAAIKEYYSSPNGPYIADPHTAVALFAATELAKQVPPDVVQIVLSTAHPAKFSEAVEAALEGYSEFDFDRDVLPEEFKGLLSLPQRVIDVWKVDAEQVKRIIARTAVRDVEFSAAVAAAQNSLHAAV